MVLDRQSIERKDFPIGRRGYEPESVDAHLAKLAREFEALQRSARSVPSGGAAAPATSLASIAGTQVQAIIEAAETSASAIEREARENVEQVQQDAAREARSIRDEAVARSQEHVGKVHEATALMLQRVDAMEGELGSLVESLRTGANRLAADLSLLSGNMGELYSAAGSAEDDAPAGELEAVAIEEVEVVAVEEPEQDYELESDDAPGGSADADADDDVEGARLIALNMALNGQTRTETDKYLADNFDLSDRSGLLDEVYATVEG